MGERLAFKPGTALDSRNIYINDPLKQRIDAEVARSQALEEQVNESCKRSNDDPYPPTKKRKTTGGKTRKGKKPKRKVTYKKKKLHKKTKRHN